MKLPLVLSALVATPLVALADDATGKSPVSDEPTAADLADAPLPGEESGRLDRPSGPSTAREVARGALVVPKIAVEAVMAPVRGTLWAYERYAVSDRFNDTFYDNSRTYGIYPTLHVDASYGVTIGGRLVHRNIFGARERFALRGGAGGEFRQVLDAQANTGKRLGEDVRLELRGELERRPRDPFYGVGNIDNSIETRHRQQIRRATTTLDIRAVDELHVRVSGAILDLEYAADTDGPMITEVYPAEMLSGFDTGMRNAYGELELRFDRRQHTNKFDAHAIPDRGYLLAAFAGRVHQLEMGEDYWRYGGEAQHFLPLSRGGMRTLNVRLHVETVTGGYNDVAFTQLPQLGGATMLRGYPAERFRDRAAMIGSLEYFWDLSRILMASLFVDAGRVYADISEVPRDAIRDMRVGYGASLQLHSTRNFLASVNVATSIDGGVFFNLALDPVYEPPSRLRQK